MTTLDLSKNTALSKLYCYDCGLTSVNTKNCADLEIYSCMRNRLAAIDVSGNPALTNFYSEGNPMTELDVRKCPVLRGYMNEHQRITEQDCDWFGQYFSFGTDVTVIGDFTSAPLSGPADPPGKGE